MPKLIRFFTIASIFVAAPMLLAACGIEEDATLSAPTNFAATYDSGAGAVHATWEPTGTPDMFMVMRVDMDTQDTMGFMAQNTETSYDDDTAESGKTYMYMVHAMLGEDLSDPSNKVMVTIP